MKAFLSLLATTPFLGFGLTAALSPEAARPVAVEAEALKIDSAHSTVVFRTKHLGVSHFWGRFNDVRGELTHDQENPSKSSIRVEIAAESIDTNSEDRDRHLKSPDFFSAKEFPAIVFESSSIQFEGDVLTITGDLELHGVKKEIQAEAQVIGSGETAMGYRAGFDAHFTIDLNDFDMTFVANRPGALGPEVEVHVAIEAVRG